MNFLCKCLKVRTISFRPSLAFLSRLEGNHASESVKIGYETHLQGDNPKMIYGAGSGVD